MNLTYALPLSIDLVVKLKERYATLKTKQDAVLAEFELLYSKQVTRVSGSPTKLKVLLDERRRLQDNAKKLTFSNFVRAVVAHGYDKASKADDMFFVRLVAQHGLTRGRPPLK